jgi:hypothetical protein
MSDATAKRLGDSGMKYLNIPVSIGHEHNMLKATHQQIGIWFLLLAYCHEQMNGGSIKACQDWSDEVWIRVAGIRSSDVACDSPLWHHSGMTLVVHFYDTQAEAAYVRKVRMGKEYSERRWGARNENKIVKIRVKNGSPNGSPIGSPNGAPNA